MHKESETEGGETRSRQSCGNDVKIKTGTMDDDDQFKEEGKKRREINVG